MATTKMSPKRKKLVLQIASLLYRSRGYEQKEGFDFSRSGHPMERECWNTALDVIAQFRSWALFAPRLRKLTAEEWGKLENGQLSEEYVL